MLTLFKPSEVRGDTTVHELAKDIAHAAVKPLSPQLTNLCQAELRGYLRARLSGEVKSQVRQAIAQKRVSSTNEAEFATAVLERAIHLISRDLASPPVTLTPAAHVATRRAA